MSVRVAVQVGEAEQKVFESDGALFFFVTRTGGDQLFVAPFAQGLTEDEICRACMADQVAIQPEAATSGRGDTDTEQKERNRTMRITKHNDDVIEFSDGSTITYEHEPDCCETNWADFSVLEVFYKGEEFEGYKVKPIEDGFLLILEGVKPSGKSHSIYIPCYSDQNGYYSSDLTINVNKMATTSYSIAAEVRDEY